MSELDLLRLLLVASLALGPLGTHRLLLAARSWRWRAAHAGALACAVAGIFVAPALCVVWLVFCAGSFAAFLHARSGALRSRPALAACVPFLFSNVAAVWLIAGAGDLHLLGYGTAFSYYAALHGNVLGWIVLGALAVLADQGSPERGLHAGVVFVCLASFVLVALGIDQLRWLKPLGVIGLSVALPVGLVAFLRSARGQPAVLALGGLALAGLLGTLLLAWGNELSRPIAPEVGGVRGMVAIHGVLNTLVVAPSLLAAVTLHRRAGAGAG